MDPAMEEPTRFLEMLRSTRAEVEVLRTVLTMWAGTMASATTDLPRPSTQLTAAGFLSVQKLPEREMISMSGNTSSILVMANSVALLSMFIPIASPDRATNLDQNMYHRLKEIFLEFKRNPPDVELPAGDPGVNPLQPGEPEEGNEEVDKRMCR